VPCRGALGAVVERAHPVEQEEPLEDEADRPGSEGGKLTLAELGRVLAIDPDLASGMSLVIRAKARRSG
jgi:hypothetical protein